MFETRFNSIKYTPEAPLTALAILTTVSLVAFSIIIALHGTYARAFQCQNICMLSLMTLSATTFITFCVLLASKKHPNNKEMVTHFFENPCAFINVKPVDSVLPKPLLKIILDYSGRKEQISFLMHFGIGVPDLKEDFQQLCRDVDQFCKTLFLPLSPGIPGVLSLPNLTLNDSCRVLARMAITPCTGRVFSLAMYLLFTPHDKDPSGTAKTNDHYTGALTETREYDINPSIGKYLREQVLNTQDVFVVNLFLQTLLREAYFNDDTVRTYATEEVFLFLVQRNAILFVGPQRNDEKYLEFLCLMGWKDGFEAFFKKAPFYLFRNQKCWENLLVGALLHKQLHAHGSLGEYDTPTFREYCPNPGQFLSQSSGNYCELAKKLLEKHYYKPPDYVFLDNARAVTDCTPEAFCTRHKLEDLKRCLG